MIKIVADLIVKLLDEMLQLDFNKYPHHGRVEVKVCATGSLASTGLQSFENALHMDFLFYDTRTGWHLPLQF